MERVDYNHTELILEKVPDNWWLSHATCNFMLCCFVHKDNKDIFTHVTVLPAGRTVVVMRLEKADKIAVACAVEKTTRPVTLGDVEYKMKKARIKGMNSQIDKNNIANIFEQIKMMKDQEEMLVMGYGRDTYKPMVLGLKNGLPAGLKKQQLAQVKIGGNSDDENNNDENNDDK
jgi:hypothetical protein